MTHTLDIAWVGESFETMAKGKPGYLREKILPACVGGLIVLVGDYFGDPFSPLGAEFTERKP